MIKKAGTYLLFLGLVIMLSVLYGFTKARNGKKKVEEISVEFEEGSVPFLTHEMVNKLLIQNQRTVKNQSKRVLDLHRLENRVLANPYVKEATVFITLGGLLKTQISHKQPIARVSAGKEVYYIDKHGAKIPLSSNFSARVPLVSGEKLENNIQEITQLVQLISADNFLKKEIIAIQKSDANEFIFHVRSGNYVIEFGDYSDVSLKFKKIKAFYNKALKDKTINKYKTINVKYHNQVVCTKQNQDGEQ
ncbi:cell division protein FtsQ/DivIB [Tenacibaculum sp. M341]|uniref:cell division protein FtsQ/DivIB n=1 Tax=Tenacibaculum sp. M341 TaxID=2530339 RepID=UPI001044ED69|nr:cell division protein FtsQ [Tenacibaculum sp. M341]TCI91471.1 cell division protein FtsQ [Tenacibaculum sp. M341]